MAAPAYLNDGNTDLGALWSQALDEYYLESGGTDLRGTNSQANMGQILAEQEEQVQLFSKFRHDKGRVDKLRTLVAQNTAIIQGVATYVANAAAASFPPSAAILTAFNYVMNAAKAVSEDYDMIVQFFDINHSFLERVSMLENRMPDLKKFQEFLLNVFKALLALCAVARKCRLSQGRMKKWCRALVDGTDPKLKAAFDALHDQLHKFEQATQIATLRTAIDSSRKLDAYGKDLQSIQTGVTEAVDLGKQNIVLGREGIAIGQAALAQGKDIYALGEESFVVAVDGRGFAKDAAVRAQEILDVVVRQDGAEVEQLETMRRMEHQIRGLKTPQQRNKNPAEQALDAGARKSTALRMLQTMVYDFDDPKNQSTEIETTFVQGTFWWLRELDIYRNLEAGVGSRLIWLTGPPGIGKSSMMYAMQKTLREEIEDIKGASVAAFYFREDADTFRSAKYMLRSCSMQIAIQDTLYREEVFSDLQRLEGKWWREKNNAKKLWKRLFLSRFGRNSGRRAVLLLDGLDEAGEEDIKETLEIIRAVSAGDTTIQIIFSSEQNLFKDDQKILVTQFELSKKLLEGDMKIVVAARMKNFNRLKKLRGGVKKKISRRLCKQADSIRYIDHMLRRFNATGREEPILKELRSLPKNNTELYDILLEDCDRSRTDKDRDVLRRFFAWLAYAKRPLTMASANKLLDYIAIDSSINVGEEVEHRSARLLRLSNAPVYGNQEEEVDENETEKSEAESKDNDDEENAEDFAVFLSFQERSLRQYFCQQAKDDKSSTGLRSPPSVGHMMVFEAISSVLTNSSKINLQANQAAVALIEYATTYWMQHLHEIKGDELTDEQAGRVIECLHAILSNRNNALKFFEESFDSDSSVFGSSDEDHTKARAALKSWADRAISLLSTSLSTSTQEWMRPLVRNQHIVYIRIAEAHVANWFLNPRDDETAHRSFVFAHNALERGRELLKQQPELSNYFAERDKSENKALTEQSILVVSQSFWQMQMTMTAQCYRAIGMAMRSRGFLEASLKQLEKALTNVDDDKDRLYVLCTMGETMVELAEKGEEEALQKEKEAKQKAAKEARAKLSAPEATNGAVTAPPEATEISTEGTTPESKKTESEITTSTNPGIKSEEAQSTQAINVAEPEEAKLDKSKSDEPKPDEPKPDEPKPDWAQKACDVLGQAAELIPKMKKYSDNVDQDRELKVAIIHTHVLRAQAELLKGNSANLIPYLTEAMKVPSRNKTIVAANFTEKLAKRSEWAKILELVDVMSREDRLQFTWFGGEHGLYLQRAGQELGQLARVEETFHETLRLFASWRVTATNMAWVWLDLAGFYQTVVRGAEALAKAKVLLNRVLLVSDESALISSASFRLADILVEEFRSTKGPNAKMAAQGDMKTLVARLRENMGSDFEWTQSQTTIPLAYMTRKLAAVEFHRGLDATFQGCVGLLRDDRIGNDRESLRILARVLAYVPGLERDSRIAATCQMYILDMEMFQKEELEDVDEEDEKKKKEEAADDKKKEEEKKEDEKKGGETTNGEAKEDDPPPPYDSGTTNPEVVVPQPAEDSPTNGLNGDEKGPAAVANGTEVHAEEKGKEVDKAKENEKGQNGVEQENGTDGKDKDKDKDEDTPGKEGGEEEKKEAEEDVDVARSYIVCRSCRKVDGDWQEGAWYMCYYCTDTDLCEECYDAKVACDKGEKPADWRTLCPAGHKHIKAPVEGWKGIKDGVMRFEKDLPIRFDTWLLELKGMKWPEAWDRFWSEEMRE